MCISLQDHLHPATLEGLRNPTYLNWGELVIAVAAAAAAAAISDIPGSDSFCDAVVEAELGRDIGSRVAGGGSVGRSSILIPRNWNGASW